MARKLVRKGQAVHSADGVGIGRVLQCFGELFVVGDSRWATDHYLFTADDVAASGEDVLILCRPREAIAPETAVTWLPAPDPQGNADGVDVELLRAGMAEAEDPAAGVARPVPVPPAPAPARPAPSPPSEEDAMALDAARLAQLDADVDHRLDEEIEDFENGAACTVP